ncbi:CHAP domain-containing protein [Novosphingobium colocasiae]|uniref:CHAP domain-containing protein n=1 Tax=Novosphingobium colocasiae TaxID=1256513 RepID=UPI0035AF8D50
MRVSKSFMALAFVATIAAPATASVLGDMANDSNSGGDGLTRFSQPRGPAKLECVPYARVTSGIQIYGDAHTWWGQAKGRYATGRMPRVGAVMAVDPHNNSRLGHVATVSRIIDSRTILLSHANWSYPGQIERNVTALDVSDANDWSEVRIWYGPAHNLGTTHWPVRGFIYNARPGSLKNADLAVTPRDIGGDRLAGLAGAKPAARLAKVTRGKGDPIGRIIADRY